MSTHAELKAPKELIKIKEDELSPNDTEGIINFVKQYLYCNYRSFYTNPNFQDDIFQECMLSVIQSFPKYDPEKAKLCTFLGLAVKCGIKKFRMFNDDKSEETLRNSDAINKATITLQNMDLPLTIENIGMLTGIGASRAIKQMNRPTVELETDEDFLDTIPTEKSVESIIDEKATIRDLMSVLAALPTEDQLIIKDFIEYLNQGNDEIHLPSKIKTKLRKAQTRAKMIRDGYTVYT